MNTHFFPTSEAPENFSKTSKESAAESLVFSPEDPLLLDFLESPEGPLAAFGFGFSVGSSENLDSATT